jgi:hypothetical protein
MDRVLVLWQQEGEVYRAYAPRYPQCTTEGSSPEAVGEKMTAILRHHLASQANGNGVPFEILLAEDQRPKDRPPDELDILGEPLNLDIDPETYEFMLKFNSRVTEGMTNAEALAHFNALLVEEEQQGRKWSSSEEMLAELDQPAREEQSGSEDQA